MPKLTVTVREYAQLTTESVPLPSLDRAQLNRSAFDWLCRIGDRADAPGTSVVRWVGRNRLALRNYVGVIETPCGTRIEVLPKAFDDVACVERSRRLLRKMICAAIDLPVRSLGETTLQTFDVPLTEWVMSRFLMELNRLTKRGLRFDYKRVQSSERFLRGQLDIARQVRKPPGRLHEFEIDHDVFSPDRPENRLLRLALDEVATATQLADNWKLAHELRTLLKEIPPSRAVQIDLRGWGTDRLAQHYKPVRPWCELVLQHALPMSLVGDWHGISLLFPMERLFERYFAAWIAGEVLEGVRVRAQAASEYLCQHLGVSMFRLKPDLLLQASSTRWLIDTKWKLLQGDDRENKYGLSEADMYQLFAYGAKYLGPNGGHLVLVYPRTADFATSLAEFDLGRGIHLHVLPFDLENEELLGAMQGSLPLREPVEICDRITTALA